MAINRAEVMMRIDQEYCKSKIRATHVPTGVKVERWVCGSIGPDRAFSLIAAELEDKISEKTCAPDHILKECERIDGNRAGILCPVLKTMCTAKCASYIKSVPVRSKMETGPRWYALAGRCVNPQVVGGGAKWLVPQSGRVTDAYLRI